LCWSWPLAQAQQPPLRIVSLSLCTDELVLMLADRERIASVSYLAANTDYSRVSHLAAGLPLNRARAEEIIALEADLILTSQFSAGSTVSLLERLGHQVHSIDLPRSLNENEQVIREVARLLGQSRRGEILIKEIQDTIARASQEISEARVSATGLFYTRNGFSYGAGTFRDFFLTSIGWRNLASDAGLTGPVQISLETVLSGQPDYLLLNSMDSANENLAHHMLRHPALQKVVSADNMLVLSERFFQCPGSGIADAYTAMAAQLTRQER
ncbi:MAG: ABC transporter substrate-binding protein, partial [Pseudohongiellaceae bacterium]